MAIKDDFPKSYRRIKRSISLFVSSFMAHITNKSYQCNHMTLGEVGKLSTKCSNIWHLTLLSGICHCSWWKLRWTLRPNVVDMCHLTTWSETNNNYAILKKDLIFTNVIKFGFTFICARLLLLLHLCCRTKSQPVITADGLFFLFFLLSHQNLSRLLLPRNRCDRLQRWTLCAKWSQFLL